MWTLQHTCYIGHNSTNKSDSQLCVKLANIITSAELQNGIGAISVPPVITQISGFLRYWPSQTSNRTMGTPCRTIGVTIFELSQTKSATQKQFCKLQWALQYVVHSKHLKKGKNLCIFPIRSQSDQITTSSFIFLCWPFCPRVARWFGKKHIVENFLKEATLRCLGQHREYEWRSR
jgi:hypothetical protein